jgi:hypothetical protein
MQCKKQKHRSCDLIAMVIGCENCGNARENELWRKLTIPGKVYKSKGRFTEGPTNVVDGALSWQPSTVV